MAIPMYDIIPGDPSICLPSGMNRFDLVDITVIGDRWRRYLDTKTGEIHDGAVYIVRAEKWQEYMLSHPNLND